MRKVVFLILIMMTGCAEVPPVRTDSIVNAFPDIIQWVSFPTEPYGYFKWRQEAHKRWANPIIFACHGGGGWVTQQVGDKFVAVRVWMAYPEGAGRTPMPVESIAWTLHNAYPQHDIILCVCNKDGEFSTHVPRVWYAKAKVWATPDGWGVMHEEIVGEGDVGTVWEFVEGDGKMPALSQTMPVTEPTTCPTTQPAVR